MTALPSLDHHSAGDVALPTGVRLHVVEQGDPDGIPVILLHGYSDTWYSWSRVLPLLSSRLRAYALDQRGHGASDKPATGYSMRELAADVLGFMDVRGIPRATILGHSMGSFVAQQVALAAPSRVEALVLIGPAADVNAFNGMDEFEAVVEALPEPVPLEFTRDFQESTIHVPLPPEFVDRVSDDSRRLPAFAWRALMRGMRAMGSTTGLRDSRIPALIAWGEQDSFVPRAAVDALLEILPDAALSVYEETGHATHWERPERFAREMGLFLETLPRGAAGTAPSAAIHLLV
jgi:pimeloyl-ACP methyl ester carboxylesterase